MFSKRFSSGWILLVPNLSLLKHFDITLPRHQLSKIEGSGPPLMSHSIQFHCVCFHFSTVYKRETVYTRCHMKGEGMSQHFHIWRDKQTIQGLWPKCIWKDKQNQGKSLVLEPKTRNQNAYYTKTLRWISSKLTPADASCTCASFCIWSHSCADPQLCAIAVSLPSTANVFLITKQPRDKNSEPCQQILRGFRNERCQQNDCWTRTTFTGVSNKWHQCTNSKG